MSGGITQLVAVGAQDVHLVGNPEVSLFQSQYKRHTNFAQLTDRQVIQGNPVANGMSSIRLERKGDLISHIYFTVNSGTSAVELTPAQWKSAIDKVEILVGGQIIDTHHSEYSLDVHAKACNTTYTKLDWAALADTAMYPLRFSFFEYLQSAIPLIALQYHDVELRVYWGDTLGGTPECYANFIYLDTDEREMFVSRPRDMLITQVTRMPPPNSTTADLNFNHPVKFIASPGATSWVAVNDKLKLQVNGVDLADFKFAQPHFTEAPLFYNASYGDMGQTSGLFLHSWATCLDKLQPTGSLNFSRIDSARLLSTSSPINSNIYAMNYNILRIENGLGGLLYSN
tara:strand:+ start:14145 stop:15170 length:1026 start_codon:yes stop_codon:yes gene_type:complete